MIAENARHCHAQACTEEDRHPKPKRNRNVSAVSLSSVSPIAWLLRLGTGVMLGMRLLLDEVLPPL
jgi:hypothetical protein